MPIEYGPFTAGSGRTVSSQKWQRMARAWRGDGVIYENYGATSLQVSADGSGMTVQVSDGEALLQGEYFRVYDGPEPLVIAAADGTYDRIDLVVVRMDRVAETVALTVLTGDPAATPAAKTPTTNDSVWEIPLAEVRVAAGATSIGSGDVTDRRGAARHVGGPYIERARTITIAVGDDAQAVQDAADHYIAPGETVYLVLADGVHKRSEPLYIRGWYGGGTLIVTSAAGDTTKHTTQPVTLDFTGAACWGVVVDNCTVNVVVRDIKVLVDDGQVGILVNDNNAANVQILGCYADGGGTTVSRGIATLSGQVYISNCYANNCYIGIGAYGASVVHAVNCSYDTIQPVLGAGVTGVLVRAGTVITGSTADVAGSGLYT